MKTLPVLLVLMTSFAVAQAGDTGTINLKLAGFENDQGRALMVIFNGQTGFPRDHSQARPDFSKACFNVESESTVEKTIGRPKR